MNIQRAEVHSPVEALGWFANNWGGVICVAGDAERYCDSLAEAKKFYVSQAELRKMTTVIAPKNIKEATNAELIALTEGHIYENKYEILEALRELVKRHEEELRRLGTLNKV